VTRFVVGLFMGLSFAVFTGVGNWHVKQHQAVEMVSWSWKIVFLENIFKGLFNCRAGLWTDWRLLTSKVESWEKTGWRKCSQCSLSG